MDSDGRARKTYLNHRENQLERILEAAEALFIQDGIDNVSMGAIADTARISRKTLYEYFPNKQEIAWAIFQKFTAGTEAGFDRLLTKEGSGFKRIEHFMLEMIHLLETYPEHLRFIVEFNTLYAREGNPSRVRQMYARGSDQVTGIIRQGIMDGSIRPDLDPELLSAALLNLVNALNSRFSLLGELIGAEYGWSVKAMYQEVCRAFLRGIQTAASSQAIDEHGSGRRTGGGEHLNPTETPS